MPQLLLKSMMLVHLFLSQAHIIEYSLVIGRWDSNCSLVRANLVLFFFQKYLLIFCTHRNIIRPPAAYSIHRAS
jgi:hypothetical protein